MYLASMPPVPLEWVSLAISLIIFLGIVGGLFYLAMRIKDLVVSGND